MTDQPTEVMPTRDKIAKECATQVTLAIVKSSSDVPYATSALPFIAAALDKYAEGLRAELQEARSTLEMVETYLRYDDFCEVQGRVRASLAKATQGGEA